jgi:hypothetical protein
MERYLFSYKARHGIRGMFYNGCHDNIERNRVRPAMAEARQNWNTRAEAKAGWEGHGARQSSSTHADASFATA